MNIGTALVAPEGFGSLKKGDVHYLLANTGDPSRVILVRLWQKTERAAVIGQGCDLLTLSRDSFEAALIARKLIARSDQLFLPPWLEEFKGKSLSAVVQSRPAATRHIERWDLLIKDAVKDIDSILKGRHPDREINRHAALKKQNTGRFRLHLCLYILFGRNPRVLMPQSFRSGRYSRDHIESVRKAGRPSSISGRDYGTRITLSEKERIVEAYRRIPEKLGRPRCELCRGILTKLYRCTSRGVGYRALQRIDGKALPTYRQVNRLLIQTIGLEQLQIDRFGSERVRNRIKGSKGSFGESTVNLNERMEADAYSTAQHPTGLEGETLPKVYVVRLRDTLSGMLTGIGFSLGAERESAYAMAKFCAAINKVVFAGFFGLEIKPTDWPCIGLPSKLIVDRGPGATSNDDGIAIVELSPSYSGQSKAIVESSHPRADLLEGQPYHQIRNGSSTRLCANEIVRLLIDVDTSERRRTPEMIIGGIRQTPLGAWEYFHELGRDNSLRMPFSEAVKRYLPSVEVKVSSHGIDYYGVRFRPVGASEKAAGQEILDRAARHSLHVKAYLLPMSLRQIWIEWDECLIEFKAHLPIGDSEAQLFMSLDELKQLGAMEKRDRVLFEDHKDAVTTSYNHLFADTFGEPYDQSTRKIGRAKHGRPNSRQQAATIRRVVEGAR